MIIRLLDQAEQDLVRGRDFYERQQQGLGDYFLDSIIADIESLYLYAGIHAMHFGYHRLLAKRFPFAIYYLFSGDEVRIYAILDCRKNPSLLSQRLS